MSKYKVRNFTYNGIFVKENQGYAEYTARFLKWTNDPGIALCTCSDGQERLIPSCVLIGNGKLPKEPKRKNPLLLGYPATS